MQSDVSLYLSASVGMAVCMSERVLRLLSFELELRVELHADSIAKNPTQNGHPT